MPKEVPIFVSSAPVHGALFQVSGFKCSVNVHVIAANRNKNIRFMVSFILCGLVDSGIGCRVENVVHDTLHNAYGGLLLCRHHLGRIVCPFHPKDFRRIVRCILGFKQIERRVGLVVTAVAANDIIHLPLQEILYIRLEPRYKIPCADDTDTLALEGYYGFEIHIRQAQPFPSVVAKRRHSRRNFLPLVTDKNSL